MPDVVFNPSLAREGRKATGRWELFASHCDDGETYWTAKKSIRPGDLYLFWFGTPMMFVGGVGVHDGTTYESRRWGTEFGFKPLLKLSSTIGVEDIRADPTLAGWWAGNPFMGRPKTLLRQPASARRMLELVVERNPTLSHLVTPYLRSLSPASRPSSSRETKRWATRISALTLEERERVYREVRRAERDRALRPAVLALWGTSCAACGVSLCTAKPEWECEVAHIRGVGSQGADDVENALPLCRTHHWAFDNHLWAVHPRRLEIVVSPSHRRTSVLANLHGRKLAGDPRVHAQLSRKYLQERLRALAR
jgi:hypothetical protein